MLLLARLDDGELHTAKETLRFDELLASVIESVGDLAGARGIELRAEAMEPLLVTGDLSQLGRLFLNLLDNALKFTAAGGSVTVRLRREGTWTVATVTDTGQGIAPEHLPFLGQRFYRGAADRSRSMGGSGLGLAIAKEIVRTHGGTLAIDSVAGKGTTVTVRLPLFTTAPES
ncbi:sensor histidine kinase [Chloroflexus sp.]|uniref:sensor histidine kinase n=1 Tax=Chloroflexus sp. TaxID=1904827 RepID=UPI003A10075D